MPQFAKHNLQHNAWIAAFYMRNQPCNGEECVGVARSIVVIKASPYLLIVVATQGNNGLAVLSSEPNSNHPFWTGKVAALEAVAAFQRRAGGKAAALEGITVGLQVETPKVLEQLASNILTW